MKKRRVMDSSRREGRQVPGGFEIRFLGKIVLGILVQLLHGCAPIQHYPLSDHYDGAHFYNRTEPRPNSLLDGIKFGLTFDPLPWPEHVDNATDLDVNKELSSDAVAVTIVNHATVLLQSKGINILTDPVWSDRVSPFAWIGPKRHRAPGIALDNLPKIDVVLISHNHYDHLDIATLVKLNDAFHPKFVVPLGCADLLRANDIANVVELDWWASTESGSDVRIFLTPAHHFSGRGLFDRDRTLWGSYYLLLHGHRIYFAGDTAYAGHFKNIRRRFGAPEIAFLPIGAYEPRWFMKQVHMDPTDAIQAHLDLLAEHSVAIHHGTFQLTAEGIDQPATALEIAMRMQNIPADKFEVLKEGRTKIFELEPVRSTN